MRYFNLRNTAVMSLLALGSLLLAPGTSEAQRLGGGRGYGYGYGNSYGRPGGYYNGGYWGGGLGISVGTPGYYGGNRNPYTYGTRYGNPYYSGGYFYPVPTYTYSAPYTASIPQTSYYPSFMNTNVASFSVRVPDPNAEIWFQDYRTQQTGTIRQFQSQNLDPNASYMFQVRARWMQNGQMMDQTRQVTARAGQTYTVDFSSEAVPVAPSNRPTNFDLGQPQNDLVK